MAQLPLLDLPLHARLLFLPAHVRALLRPVGVPYSPQHSREQVSGVRGHRWEAGTDYDVILCRNSRLFRFDFFAHTVALNYQSSLLTAGEEAALVLLGPLTVLLIFLLLMLLTLVCILTVHRFPQLCSQFVLAYGVTALLDPFLILVIDLIIGVGVFFSFSKTFSEDITLLLN